MQTYFQSLSSSGEPRQESRVEHLMRRAMAGVLRGAQDGGLPLFSWTLGLPQHALMVMITEAFPELGEKEDLEPLTAAQYARILMAIPAEFEAMVALLRTHASPEIQEKHVDWLTRTIAAASFGERHLWEDLGLGGRNELDYLLKTCFTALYQQNTKRMKWKRFLFALLGQTQGQPDLRPPGCGRCDHSLICFPDRNNQGYGRKHGSD